MTTTAILTAAGSGTRLGADLPKALVPINKVPMVRIAAANLFASGEVDELIVTVPNGYLDQFAEALDDLEQPITFVIGGSTRQNSISNALKQLNPDCIKVLVHDAARPFAPPSLIAKVANALKGAVSAVIPVLPVADTIKVVSVPSRATAPNVILRTRREESGIPEVILRTRREESGIPEVILRTRREESGSAESQKRAPECVEETLDRSTLRAVQTPQGFDRETLEKAYRYGIGHEVSATDDAELVEKSGVIVHLVEGDAAAMKITTPTDLKIATFLYAAASDPMLTLSTPDSNSSAF